MSDDEKLPSDHAFEAFISGVDPLAVFRDRVAGLNAEERRMYRAALRRRESRREVKRLRKERDQRGEEIPDQT